MMNPSTRTITAGDRIGPATHTPTARQLVEYSVAARELAAFHYDARAAATLGVDRPIVNAGLKAAWFTQLLEAWAGPEMVVQRLELRHRGMDLVDDEYRIEGEVTAVADGSDGMVVSVSLRGVGPSGVETATGSAEVRR